MENFLGDGKLFAVCSVMDVKAFRASEPLAKVENSGKHTKR